MILDKIDLPKNFTVAALKQEMIINGNTDKLGVIIKKIMPVEFFDASNQKTIKYAVYFIDSDYRLVLNATNLNMMIEMFGNDTEQWIGQTMHLTLVDYKDNANSTYQGVRVQK